MSLLMLGALSLVADEILAGGFKSSGASDYSTTEPTSLHRGRRENGEWFESIFNRFASAA
jgi:hypothetical protein